MSALLEQMMASLEPGTVAQVAAKIGVPPAQAQAAIQAALPVILGALGRNAGKPQGAQAIASALQHDHSTGNPLDALRGALGGGGQGAAILGHIFGNRQGRAAQGVGAASGLNAGQSGQLLAILAPMVMSFLGKQQDSGQLDRDSLGAVLGGAAGKANPLLAAVLDKNGDGDIDFADISAAASDKGGLGGVLGGLFGSGR